ncbi:MULTISPECIES: MFS transporter [Sphingobium]|jgi:MFS family permease|uniref:MFS transporter n=1 Tax=Sphingobium fuliginis (strain ATCC 27551) TaxID=336203 RepID=A0A292ZGM8_SPHSA|nr:MULTISPECIES: MFS transporter [Sphingobium]QOT70339.1 MFS transporter [Sphingobium fuliginis]GAY22000.1 major facilitator superfamily MFS_1 [Sphingobium fuliginis]
MTTAAQEWKKHWPTLAAASVGVATGFSMLQFNASIFIQPWQDNFGWSRGEIAAAHNGMILTAILSPFAGTLLDRHGVRRPLLAAMTLTGLAYLAMTRLGGSLVQFYATYLALQVIGIFTTGLAFTRVVAARFVKSRGLALACTRVGISILGIFLPATLHALVAREGWQAGFYLLAGIVLLVGLPVCWFGIRDAERSDSTEWKPQARPAQGESYMGLLRREPRVLLLCLCAGFGYAPLSTLLSQFQPLLTALDISPADAAMLTGVLAGSVLIGTLISGTLIDRIWAPAVACLFSLGPILGCILMLQGSLTFPMALTAAVLIGAAQGAEIDIVAYMAARYFGMRHYSAIYGSTITVMTLMAVAGQVGIGFLYDRFGNYQVALIAVISGLVASILLYLLMGRYPQQVEAKPDRSARTAGGEAAA